MFRGLQELRNKEIRVPHFNFLKLSFWVGMGVFASFLMIYIFLGQEMLNYFPLLLIFAFATPLISLMSSKSMVKRAYRIRPLGLQDYHSEKEKLVVDTIVMLSEKLNLRNLPEMGIYASYDVNAFATGASKNAALVAVSQGLLERMDETEIIGVLAHEMSHVVNGDMLTSSILEGFVSAFAMVATLPFLMGRNNRNERGRGAGASMMTYYMIRNVANIFGRMIASFYSRRREFAADRLAAEMTGAIYMKSALQKLQALHQGQIPLQNSDREFASFKISNNFSMAGLGNLFATHPSLEKRIAAIEELEARGW